ncbi:hypothetical protein EJ070_26505 [Mesorhizobium sp. M1E.F.Ca.ET.045.02.1.1]|uniref:hypothetical protein n=1 Tax=Mesorhizobium sp. M1E.F.Ca.ET.045.02.1.1 TaxID=2493672 RepID=UPI000F75DD24|nr:hypothetical protein [Mesorhizobium sp. M1E.F.Ca.ET.045.02.1.1]AZO23883.1 hypothetical protein EJ070_26505 [Mesorhizobium sp. M1E.F.Ca.ET.045.02.1.1]
MDDDEAERLALKRARKRRDQATYRARNPEKVRERNRAYRAQNPDKERERNKINQRAYVAKHRDEINARKRQGYGDKDRAAQRRYREKHREDVKVRLARYRRENREKLLAYNRRYYLEVHRERLLAKRLRLISVSTANHSPEGLMRAVNAAISPALPRFIKDEIAGEMMLAVLEGTLLLDQIRAKVQEYLRRYNRDYDTFKVLSLDAPIAGTDLRRIDTLTSRDSVFSL